MIFLKHDKMNWDLLVVEVLFSKEWSDLDKELINRHIRCQHI